MTTKQRFKFLTLNILGFSLLAAGVLAYFELTLLISAGLSLLGFLLVLFSFHDARLALADATPLPNVAAFTDVLHEVLNQEDAMVTSDLNEANAVVDTIINHDETQHHLESKAHELNYYTNLDTSLDASVLKTTLFEIEMLKDNLNALVDAMNTYGLVKENPTYHYRLESFLKLELFDTRVDELLYQPVPAITLTPQFLESAGQTIYMVKAGINANRLMPIGYLPYSVHLDVTQIKAIQAFFRGGSYRFLDSHEKDFMTCHDDLKLHILIYT